MAYSINQVSLLGRLTKDPAESYTTSGTCCARFNLAIDNGKDSEGKDRQADFPSVVVWGKLAEIAAKTLTKGQRCFVSGKIKTGSYDRNGVKIYYTEILAQQLIPLDRPQGDVQQGGNSAAYQSGNPDFGNKQMSMDIPDGFEPGDDIPF